MPIITGTPGPDRLQGTDADDTLLAGAGSDTLEGGLGEDQAVIDRSAATAAITLFILAPALPSDLDGTRVTGVEHFHFTAGAGDDRLAGGPGADTLLGGAGQDALWGGAGADALAGGDGADTLLGGLGADTLTGGGGADLFLLQGTGAVESTLAAPDRITDFAAAEGDRLALRGQAIGAALWPLTGRSFGLPGVLPLLPVGFADPLPARAAPVAGMALPDATGGAAHTLFWQPGLSAGGWLLLDADRDGILGAADLVVRFDLTAGVGISPADFLPGSFATLGSLAADSLTGTAGADSILGFAGADTLDGAAGDDTLDGGAGADRLLGGPGLDRLLGGADADTLEGGAGADILEGGAGDDTLLGGPGDDILLGGPGDDSLDGGEGDDSLAGGPGADVLRGGPGADTLLLQAMGEAAWSSLAAPDSVLGFDRAAGDRLRISDGWMGGADGVGANAGTYTGADGVARPLLFNGSTGRLVAAPVAGLSLPRQPLGGLDSYQLSWVPGTAGGGWLVLDLDRDGVLGEADLLVRLDGPDTLGPEDFIPGTFLLLAGGIARAGTAADDTLRGGSLGEAFAGSLGADWIDGGPGAGNALGYAGLGGPVAARFSGLASGTVAKPGGATDRFTAIHSLGGTAGDDTLDASGALPGMFTITLEGLAGADRLMGDGGPGVQVSYASSPRAVLVDLQAGTAEDGWGSTDTLVDIRRVVVTSGFGDTVFGTAGDDVFVSGTDGNNRFDGRTGTDAWRYAGVGAVTVTLAPPGLIEPHVLKPGGTDRLFSIEIIATGPGDDNIIGSAADERFLGGAGDDSIDGGNGFDTVSFDGGGIITRGAIVNLTTGRATDPWGGTDTLRNIEHAWGTMLGDDLTGLALPGAWTWLRGLAGNDTLRAPAPGTAVGADYAADPAGIIADLAAGQVQDGWGGTDTLALIRLLRGSGFADRIAGGALAETLLGGVGDDTLEGGGGADLLIGGPGDDTYWITDPAAIIVEAADEGWDTLVTAIGGFLPWGVEAMIVLPGTSFASGNDADNRITGSTGPDQLHGGAGQDTVLGGDGADTLFGSLGDDWVDAGPGDDILTGNAGLNTLFGGAGDDSIIADPDQIFSGTLLLGLGDGAAARLVLAGVLLSTDSLDGGDGVDRWFGNTRATLLDLRGTPWAAVGMEWFLGGPDADALLLDAGMAAATLAGGDGADTLSGTAAGDVMDGGTGDDLLAGQDGDDTLFGGAGADTLRGGAGADALNGLDGPDVVFGGTGDDSIWAFDGDALLDGGAGYDLLILDRATLRTPLRLRLAEAVAADGLTTALAGFEVVMATGGAGDDWLVALAGDDTLRGGAGQDTLEGGDGADLLAGDDGDDWLDGGPGANWLYGGAGEDTLVSAGWDALLDGGAGADLALLDRGFASLGLVLFATALTDGLATTLLAGIDRIGLTAGAGDDSLLGGAAADTLRGGAGRDTLDGGAGADWLFGGPGDDLFFADRQDDLAFEFAGQGVDTVIATVGYYLWPELEVLVLAPGAGDIFGVGNELPNLLLGNAGSNLLIGWDGDDTIEGGAGADALFGVAGDDRLLGGAGIDYLVGGDGADTLDGGADPDSLYGQDGDDLLVGGPDFVTDILVGGPGRDTLDGASGLGDYDLLDGGAGDDLYYVDTPFDLTFEAPDGGTDTVIADIRGAGYYLWPHVENLILRGETPFGVGNDLANRLTGSAGPNWLLGGAGDDTLDGGGGDDVLFGEAGADAFILRGGGTVVIGDFTPGEDRLWLAGTGFADAGAVLAATGQFGASCAFHLPGGELIILINVDKAALSAGDFLFG